MSVARYKRVADTPHMWIGAVSWLKAALFGDTDTYVPATVAAVREMVGESFPVLDDTLIQRLMGAWERPNLTGYALADPGPVRVFLVQHVGKPVCTVSW